jgi:purine-nucleoside phosphorylase
VILGSGLGQPAEAALTAGGCVVPFEQIPDLPTPGVSGHAGRLVIGRGPWQDVILLQGRVHYYEGHPLDRVTFAVRMLAALGIRQLIVTNAAGGIRNGFRPGDLMVINGHWTFLNVCSERVPARQRTGRLWNRELQRRCKTIPTSLRIHEGVYAMMPGPNYETPAEVRMLQHFGIDAVGMSTVPESLVAARRGIRVLGLSCITNVASGLSENALDHSEVTQTAATIESAFTDWLQQLTETLRSH